MDGLSIFYDSGQITDYSLSLSSTIDTLNSIDLTVIKDLELDNKLNFKNIKELLLGRKHNNYSQLKKFLLKENFDIYHCLNNGFSIPFDLDFNYVITCNNLIALNSEEFCNPSYVDKFFSSFPYAILNSKAIICPSNSIKRELMNSFSIDENLLYVNYGTIPDFYEKQDDTFSFLYLKSKYNIDYDFILFCGDFHRRKNLEGILECFFRLHNLNPNIKLIFLCKNFNDKGYFKEIQILINSFKLNNHVVFIENYSNYDKMYFFSKALCFLDLSFYESVNLNIIQALKCKCKIICSPIEIYKEYLLDYGHYIDLSTDFNETELLDYIKTPSNNSDLKDHILNKFSFKTSLNILNLVYETVLNI